MEWTAFRALLPNLRDKRVLDLGCGFGWHCRYASQQKAKSVVGVDLSEKMLARAKELGDDPRIDYQRSAIEDIAFLPKEFDVVISSLLLHYVADLDVVCQKVHGCLNDDGKLVLSVEHPVFTSLPDQDWFYGQDGTRHHWPLDRYQEEGARQTQWLSDNVVKYHRTIATYLNTLIASGFCITDVSEPVPPQEMLISHTDMKDEFRRPMFLLIAATKVPQP